MGLRLCPFPEPVQVLDDHLRMGREGGRREVGGHSPHVPVEKAVLSPDRKTLTLTLPGMQPAMTMRLKFKIQSADGKPVEQEIHATIHRVPGMAAK